MIQCNSVSSDKESESDINNEEFVEKWSHIVVIENYIV